ncbi:MAG: DUF2298 domain-containing protein, partial [Anaerolineales bacterium]
FPQFFIMFGTALVPLAVWLGWKVWRDRRSGEREPWLLVGATLGIPLAMFLASSLGAGLAYLVFRAVPSRLASMVSRLGAEDVSSLVDTALQRRLTGSWTALFLGLMLAGCMLLLRRLVSSRKRDGTKPQQNATWPFIVMLIAVGAMLVLFPEFFHLRDLFETRMNTIFKFYFAAWVLWGLAGAYAAIELWPRRWWLVVAPGFLLAIGPQIMQFLQRAQEASLGGGEDLGIKLTIALYLLCWGIWIIAAIVTAIQHGRRARNWLGVLRGAAILPVFLGLVYTVSATITKTGGFVPASKWTLDGNAYLSQSGGGEWGAIEWINQNLESGVIAEAIGGSYTGFARVSTRTGLPTVLGWWFHEDQWRGGPEARGSRESDIQRLYQCRSWEEAKEIIDRYRISYIFVGWLEETTYSPISVDKFELNMQTIYQTAEVTIYAMPDRSGR